MNNTFSKTTLPENEYIDNGYQNKWDMIVLKNLGLDHISHVHKLRKPELVEPKL